jgi:2-keto-4-pentenoate hydratase
MGEPVGADSEGDRDRDRAAAAGALLEAYASGVPVEPIALSWPTFDIDDAYAVQQLQVQRWNDDGRTIKGFKVGLTSAAMQEQLGVYQPDYGILRDDMFRDDGVPIPLAPFLQPRIEPEIAFVLRHDLRGPGVSFATATSAVEFAIPALEIIDSRIRDWRITIVDTIADNASSGGVVIGGRPVAPSDIDFRLVGCLLTRNGVCVATGAGGAVLGNPLNSLVWLANTLGRHGVTLPAGCVVIPGSITASQPVRAGDTWTAEFSGMGSVSARFEGP